MRDERLIVLKFGGSVLVDGQSVHTAAAEIARFVDDGWRVIAVVSALNGETDRLVRCADALVGCEFAKAALVSTGELVSAAMLGLAMKAHAIAVEVLDSAAAGIGTEGPPLDATPVSLDICAIDRALSHVPVIIIPGFVGRDLQHRVTLLGRGGSDFTALFIAHQLGARCRLIKDVDGLYDRDPKIMNNREKPRRFETLHWDNALELDSEIVQQKAVRWAGERALEFEIATIGQRRGTRVGAFTASFTSEDWERPQDCFAEAQSSPAPA